MNFCLFMIFFVDEMFCFDNSIVLQIIMVKEDKDTKFQIEVFVPYTNR